MKSPLKVRLRAAWAVAKHAPLRTKIVLFFGVGYLLSPIDLIPDFIPVLGQLDDILVAGLLVGYLGRTLPAILEALEIDLPTVRSKK